MPGAPHQAGEGPASGQQAEGQRGPYLELAIRGLQKESQGSESKAGASNPTKCVQALRGKTKDEVGEGKSRQDELCEGNSTFWISIS